MRPGLLLSALLALGCQRSLPEAVLVDLTAERPYAEVHGTAPDARTLGTASGGAEIILPAGAAIDYFFPLPAEAWLSIDEVRPSDPTLKLRWSLELESAEGPLPGGGERPASGPIDGGRGGFRVALAGEPSAIARLRLSVAAGRGRVSIRGGRILGERVETAPAPPAPSSALAPPVAAHGSNVLVYLIDTLRADHLGCYGYDRDVSPAIDRFAAGAVLFEDVVAQSSWTKSAVASLFTGLWPTAHGANRRRDRLADTATTLAEVLRDAGYDTAAFVGNPVSGPDFGFDQGFDDFALLDRPRAGELHREAVEWLRRRGERPFFLYVHTIDPHMPYRPEPPFRARFAAGVPARSRIGTRRGVADLRTGEVAADADLVRDTIDLYDGEIASNDAAFADLLVALDELALADDTIVVVVSDHGEEFYEHGGWTHGKSLHVETVRVPLIVRLPGVPGGRRVVETVSQVDLLPSLLEALAIPVPEGVDGRSFLPLATGGELPNGPTFSYLALSGPRHLAVVEGRWKLTERRVEGVPVRRLYDRLNDPAEQRNLATERPLRCGYLAAKLRRWSARNPPAWDAEPIDLSPELAEELQALGYL